MKDVPTTCHKAEMARVATAVRVGKPESTEGMTMLERNGR